MAAVSSADVDALAAMFPDVERPVIETILEAQGGDSNRAIDAILVLKGEVAALPAAKPSPQVADSRLARALQEKMSIDDEAKANGNNAKAVDLMTADDFKEDLKAVGEAFENMGKAISRSWRELTDKLSEDRFGGAPAPPTANATEPSDDDVRLVRVIRQPTLPVEANPHDPAIPASSADSGNPLLEPSDPDAVLTLSRSPIVAEAQQSTPKN